jgi:hypothetical protein
MFLTVTSVSQYYSYDNEHSRNLDLTTLSTSFSTAAFNVCVHTTSCPRGLAYRHPWSQYTQSREGPHCTQNNTCFMLRTTNSWYLAVILSHIHIEMSVCMRACLYIWVRKTMTWISMHPNKKSSKEEYTYLCLSCHDSSEAKYCYHDSSEHSEAKYIWEKSQLLRALIHTLCFSWRD